MTLTFETPGLYAVPPGADFPAVLVDGLVARFADQPPEALARVTLYLSTRRMQRRVRDLFDAGPARLLPRLRLVSDLGRNTATGLPPPVPALRRRLELAQLVTRLIDSAPGIAPRSAAFDLATSLAALMDEMQGEGVSISDIAALDVTDQSGHWETSLRFLTLIGQFLAADGDAPLDPQARERRIAEELIRRWRESPPPHPVIVAGSTGSRGTTRLFMEAVARLPNGAVILPGVDPEMSGAVWDSLTSDVPQEDHPQYRFAVLARDLGLAPGAVPLWHKTPPPNPQRNALVSLALRPAPVTDGWRRDGPALGDLIAATRDVTLIEAPDPRAEALAIALRLRQAVEDGQTAALITPDRMLTRRVTAALDRWRIEPDDSAGEPLKHAPVGRFIRHVAGLFGRKLTAEALLVLLKHPLCHAAAGRGRHLLWTRELELSLRRWGPAFPTRAALDAWAFKHAKEREGGARETDDPRKWAEWVADCALGHEDIGDAPLADHVETLLNALDHLNIGHDGAHDGLTLWDKPDGREAKKALSALQAEADHGGTLDPAGFSALLSTVLAGEVRDPVTPHPGVMIWGTLEARVQGAELVILAGLNDGTWPELPTPDPWLNRKMRKDAGLLLPERRIGLSAHDFQQAVAAPVVVLSRAMRDAEAETVPSRWLNRLVNLMGGLGRQRGPEALEAMRTRGTIWTDMAATMDRPVAPVPPASRPAPQPPVAARPRRLSVTDVQTLIRDPYEIYARRILRLSPLDPLRKSPEPRDRGNVLHRVLERFIPQTAGLPQDVWRDQLLAIAAEVLAEDVPWPTARRLWLARLSRIADAFVQQEAERQSVGRPLLLEAKGVLTLPAVGTDLVAKADRIDMNDHGALLIYDYKTGSLPTQSQQKVFSKQLLLEAAMAENGAFDGLAPAPVSHAAYLGLGAKLATVTAPLEDSPADQTLSELCDLIAAFLDPEQGYPAQLARQSLSSEGDFDHLARAGEWDLSDAPVPVRVGE